MIFYRAVNTDGKLKLAPTKAAAKLINKEFDEFDVPTNQQGLMEVLQDLIDRAQGSSAAPEPEMGSDGPEIEPGVQISMPADPAPLAGTINCPKCSFDPARAKRNIQAQIDGIATDRFGERIMELSGWPLGQAAVAVASRFTQLAEEANDAPSDR